MENKILIGNEIVFIQNNAKENLCLQSIAENAGFSLNYFDAIFRRHTGYSPMEYARIYKLTRSALELRRTKKNVLEIALDFGYASSESFTRAFKSFYGIAPSEYREKYSTDPVTWHDISGKISISRFIRSFPELKQSDIEAALDFCFIHNPMKYAEDIIGMSVAESKIFTLGSSDNLEHFVYVSDYDSVEPVVTLVCENEWCAIDYLKLLARLDSLKFSIRKSMDSKWNVFDKEVSKLGLTRQCRYDMVYTEKYVTVPEYEGLTVRLLSENDMSHVKTFKQRGGCAECHVRAIQIYFDGKGNVGMKPIGVFENGELICLAMPTLDKVRDLKKYDIGGIFTISGVCCEKAVDLMWSYVIDYCLKDGAMIGNANATENDSPLGTAICERIGLSKIAKNCCYYK